MNALRHGLTARHALLPDERPADLRRLAEGLRAQLQPVGEHEEELLQRAAVILMRLRRCAIIDAELLQHRRPGEDAMFDDTGLATAYAKGSGPALLEGATRYEAALLRSLSRTLSILEQLQLARSRATQELAHGAPHGFVSQVGGS
jgi:hypothetical protein